MKPYAVRMSIDQTLINWDDVPVEQINDKFRRQIVYGEHMMIIKAEGKAGAEIPRHSHEHEQMTYIVEGEVDVWLGDAEEPKRMRAGDIFYFPPNIEHRLYGVTDTKAFDYYYPIRQDFLLGTDTYYDRS